MLVEERRAVIGSTLPGGRLRRHQEIFTVEAARNTYILNARSLGPLVGLFAQALGKSNESVAGGLELLDSVRQNVAPMKRQD